MLIRHLIDSRQRINRKKVVGTYILKSHSISYLFDKNLENKQEKSCRDLHLKVSTQFLTYSTETINIEVSKNLDKYWQFTKIWSWSRPLKSTILKTLILLLRLDLFFVETSQPIKNISPLGFCATKVHTRGPC